MVTKIRIAALIVTTGRRFVYSTENVRTNVYCPSRRHSMIAASRISAIYAESVMIKKAWRQLELC